MDKLPPELIFLIYEYLTVPQLCSLSIVSRQFYTWSTDAVLWKQRLKDTFGKESIRYEPKHPENWLGRFKQLSKWSWDAENKHPNIQLCNHGTIAMHVGDDENTFHVIRTNIGVSQGTFFFEVLVFGQTGSSESIGVATGGFDYQLSNPLQGWSEAQRGIGWYANGVIRPTTAGRAPFVKFIEHSEGFGPGDLLGVLVVMDNEVPFVIFYRNSRRIHSRKIFLCTNTRRQIRARKLWELEQAAAGTENEHQWSSNSNNSSNTDETLFLHCFIGRYAGFRLVYAGEPPHELEIN